MRRYGFPPFIQTFVPLKLIFPFSSRYLFGKKSTQAINIISGVSIAGIGVGTAALILVMSVLNGFEDLIKGLFNSFNADLKITLEQGKSFEYHDSVFQGLMDVQNIRSVSSYLEETALLEYKEIKDFATLKGVDTHFYYQTNLVDKIEQGEFALRSPQGFQAIVGQGIRNKLAISIDDPFANLSIFMPNPQGGLMNPFKKRSVRPAGIFSIQQDYDNRYVFVDLEFMQELVGKGGNITGYEIQLDQYDLKKQTIREIKKILGPGFLVQDRYQQDAAFYKLMKIEKWVSYAILSFVLILVAFNIVGALWMIVLEKKKDIMVLKSMGMKDPTVSGIFVATGLWITGLGIILGFIVSVVFYFLQLEFGLVPIPEGFLVDRYPLNLRVFDFIIVGITVIGIGFAASVLPAKKAARLNEPIRYE